MGKVINFPGAIHSQIEDGMSELPLEDVLSGASEANLSSVVVIGLDENEGLYFASQSNNLAKILFQLEQAKLILLGR